MERTWRRLAVVTAAGLLVFIGFSVYADTQRLGDRLADFGWWGLGAALALAALNYLLRWVRWTLYLRRVGADVAPKLNALVFVSGFALSVTPGKLGELVKAYFLKRACDIPMTQTAPIVVAERVTDLVALLLLGLGGVALYGVGTTMVAVGAAVIGVGLVILAWPALARSLIDLACRPRFLHGLRERLLTFYEGLAALLRPSALAFALPLSLVAWLAECLGFAVIIAAFPGTDVPVGLATLIYASTTIAGALSFLPGGLLVTEATMTVFLVKSARGLDEATAVAATILTRLATLWFAVGLGICAFLWLRRIVPALRGAEDLATAPGERSGRQGPGTDPT